MSAKDIRKLYFGMASAEAEAVEDPDRFLRTFYDRWNLKSTINHPRYFLIVGPKGVGKTAINEYTTLRLKRTFGDHAVFSKTLSLEEASPGISPLSAIEQKLSGENSTGITDAAWRLYISARMLDLLMQDQSSSIAQDRRIRKVFEDLQRAGLATHDFPTVLRRVRENKISISIGGIISGESTSSKSDEVSVVHLGEALIRLVLSVRSENHFILSIDGLDRIIGDNPAYWNTLAALLRVSDKLHREFRSAPTDLRIMVMCRSDVFRKISFADADKIAGDSALFVDWGAHQTIPEDSHLWDYIAKKSGISTQELFEMLPPYVTVGERTGRSRRIKTPEYLLQFTRSTPREISLLMKRIQEEVPPGGYATPQRVRAAADNFASRDLLTTVKAESSGIIASELQHNIDEALSSLPAATGITREDLEYALEYAGLKQEYAGQFAEFLFMAGLIGNYDPVSGHVQFYHRRDTYKFNRRGPWVLNRSLMYAFNIPYSRPRNSK